MAVSVTTRPSQWSAVKNPVVYTLTSTGHGALVNYRIEVEVFKASDDTSLTSGVKISCSPDSAGISYADISTIVKAYLSPDWAAPSALNEVEADTSLGVYIKYQELYDGSATAVVDDVANPFHCVFGALQIPSANGNNLTDYVPASGSSTKKFLTIFDRPKLWRGYPISLSFIHPDASALWINREQYDAAGSIIGSAVLMELTSANDNSINRLDFFDAFFVLNASAKTVKINLAAKAQILADPDFDTGIGGDWSNLVDETPSNAWANSGGVAIGVSLDNPGTPVMYSQVAFQTLAETYPAGDYVVKLNAVQSGTVDPTNTVIKLYSAGVPHAIPVYDSSSVIFPAVAGEMELSFTAFDPFDGFGLQVRRVVEGSSRTITVNSAQMLQTVDASAELTFDVADPCDNPVLLFWKNSVGGDSFWLFEYGQETGYSYSGRKKAKRMTLFAEHLTLNQWEALNELNTIGEIYAENIQEFTSSVNKSHVRDGAQVYVVDTDGSKTGVIVIPSNSVINTKDEVHSISIEIEFPERVE